MIPSTLAELAVPIESLKPYAKNPRRGNLEAIKESLEAHGQYRPIVVRAGSNEVLAGNHTLQAAQELGWSQLAVTYVEVDDEQAARIVLVDNRTSDLGSYEGSELAELLGSLTSLEGTAWQEDDLNRLLAELERDRQDALRDTEPNPVPQKPLSRVGDIWSLEEHRLVCGDATDPNVVDRLFGDEDAALLFTDPPYGVEYQVKMTVAEARKRHRRTDLLEVTHDDLGREVESLVEDVLSLASGRLRPGGAFYVCSASGPMELVFRLILERVGLILHSEIVWVKDRLVLGRGDYHMRHETLLYGWKSGAAHYFGGGRKQDTVWEIPRPGKSPEHPTMKPVELVARCISNSARQDDLVYDPFVGSGTTIIAAENLGRRCYAAEIDPRYCDVVVDRWQRHTGLKATREGTKGRARATA